MKIFKENESILREVTKRYIGLSQEEIDESLQNFFL
jgi:hypothetical protein